MCVKLNQASQITRIYRLLSALLHILMGVAIATFIWPFISKETKLKLTKWWANGLLRRLNTRLQAYGNLPDAKTNGVMFVANHISWVDIHAINSVISLRFIAKSEVSGWPIFGYLVRKSGTLFIDRSRRKDALRITEMVTESLQRGENIGFFPEGTTTEGEHLEKFKSSIVQAAIDAKTQIWPVAIRYPLPNGGVNTQMAYAGDTTMGESIFNVLKQKNPVVELHFLTPISTLGKNQSLLCLNFLIITIHLSIVMQKYYVSIVTFFGSVFRAR